MITHQTRQNHYEGRNTTVQKRKYLAIFIALAMAISMLPLMAIPVFAADDDVVPDMNLRAVINTQLKVSNKSAPISKTQMGKLTGVLVANEKSIESLEGMQYATNSNLTMLIFTKNKISDLSPFPVWQICQCLLLIIIRSAT